MPDHKDTSGTLSTDIALHGAYATVRLTGELDMITASRARARLTEAIGMLTPPLLIVDATALAFCDSTGLSVLLRASFEAQRANGRLVLSGVHGRFLRVLSITGLAAKFEIFPTVDDALSALPGAH